MVWQSHLDRKYCLGDEYMDRQNSLFDAVVSQEPKAKQRKSKEKKRSYSIGKPEVTKSVPEIPKVISDNQYSIRIKSSSG